MTCKDNCIHYEVCKGHYNENDYVGIPDAFDLFCKPEYCGRFFKNKADFVEVKHGEWEEERWCDNFQHTCSLCHKTTRVHPQSVAYKYCPYCGAKMIFEKEGADNG